VSVLLTDEAVGEIAYEIDKQCTGGGDNDWSAAEAGARSFLRFHATEGREAVVERVARVTYARAWPGCAWPDYDEQDKLNHLADAEAVVTALFGGKS
jgi:hypothetical protein